MTTDAQTLNMLLGGGRKARKPRTPAHKFAIGMQVVYCGYNATIVGRGDLRPGMWTVQLTHTGERWPSRGKDMRPAQ